MKSRWTDAVSGDLPRSEYPRPQMVRPFWQCLNGKWEYSYTYEEKAPTEYEGTILVPFSPETLLSGVGRHTEPYEILWYHRNVTIDGELRGKRLLLHFDAVDRNTIVYVNGLEVIRHRGGYLPFCAELEPSEDEDLDILVRVTDDTDVTEDSRGKQKTKRGGIWYTPQSGIWQTVWLEAVPESYVRSLRITPLYDSSAVRVEADICGNAPASAVFEGTEYPLPAEIPVPGFIPWCPEDPKLYDLTVNCGEDSVKSYFAMRKVSVEKDSDGKMRLFLNGRPYFQNGVLDQGYWPDGLYTAPTDEAMVYDIETIKACGFNMLRKHIKVEPLRWYYHCDRLGMLVWQDMPNGGGNYSLAVVSAPLFTGIDLKDDRYRLFARKDPDCREQYYSELCDMIDHLYNCPSIVMWVPFNEGWGQFDSEYACELIKELDGTRLIDHASGWHDQKIGDIRSLHVYFRPYKYKDDRLGRATVLSEFGGYACPVKGHVFNSRSFGYRSYETGQKLAAGLKKLYSGEIVPAYHSGLGASVYTQVSDVEDEVNGIMTYDRCVIKIPAEEMKEIVSIR